MREAGTLSWHGVLSVLSPILAGAVLLFHLFQLHVIGSATYVLCIVVLPAASHVCELPCLMARCECMQLLPCGCSVLGAAAAATASIWARLAWQR